MAVSAKKKVKKEGRGDFLSATDALNVLQQPSSCALPALRSVLKTLLAGGPTAETFAEDLLANGFLRLVTSILEHSSRKGVAAGIEVLGALSVSSLTAHRKVVSDRNVIRALAEILRTRPKNVELLTVACHAVEDLEITPFGCEALKESGVMSNLLHLLCWIGDLSKKAQMCLLDEGHLPESLATGETDSTFREARKQLEPHSYDIQGEKYAETKILPSALHETVFCEEVEELLTTASTAMSALILNLGIDNSSKDLCLEVLNFLRRFWDNLRRKDQMLLNSTAADDEPIWTCNRGTRQLIAKCVVQLAMELDSNCSREFSVEQGLFENTDCNQTLFFKEYWEQNPIIMSRKLPSCLSALSQTFTTLAELVNDALACFVGCPPAIADQLDSRHLLESIQGSLGGPMIYGQDIRIVKTEQRSQGTVELHYNGNGGSPDGNVGNYVHPREILEAVEKGYTVAIKGMELRCSSIADIADCLARQCGQPSVGVNMYITPANAQGLDLHYDDHCVFVCQLVGRKTWNVYPPQKLLPRLYSCRALNRCALNNSASTVYTLHEGDILYIPRGFPHKAHCEHPESGFGTYLPGSRDDTSGGSMMQNFSPGLYSLHLTFGVEVEPPFEWEGLIHTALRLWAEKRWQNEATLRPSSNTHSSGESFTRDEQLCEGLLHIAINLLGDREPALRKACMIAAEASRPQRCSSDFRAQEEAVASPEGSLKVFFCEQGDSLVCDVCDFISLNYFQKLLRLVAEKANYKEALAFAQDDGSGEYIGSCSGGLEWLRHVTHRGGHTATSTVEPVALVMSKIKVDQCKEVNKSELEKNFSNMKAEFGTALVFHRAVEAFRSIHRQYRTMRKKITSGMLALHEDSVV
ncbi:unnamed protein product [Calypogeia fissa]